MRFDRDAAAVLGMASVHGLIMSFMENPEHGNEA
jgi:hypothetical protein